MMSEDLSFDGGGSVNVELSNEWLANHPDCVRLFRPGYLANGRRLVRTEICTHPIVGHRFDSPDPAADHILVEIEAQDTPFNRLVLGDVVTVKDSTDLRWVCAMLQDEGQSLVKVVQLDKPFTPSFEQLAHIVVMPLDRLQLLPDAVRHRCQWPNRRMSLFLTTEAFATGEQDPQESDDV